MADDAHAAANAAQLRLLQEELGVALPADPAAICPAALIPGGIAGLLPEPYRVTQRESEAIRYLPPAERDTIATWPDVEFTRPGPAERSA